MRGVFDDELDLPKEQQDAELTLGNGMLLLLFFGLVLVFGLCFGLGYSVGRRGMQPAAASPQPAAAAATSLPASGSAPKPSANAPVAAPQPAQNNPPPSSDAQPATTVVAPIAASTASSQAAQPSSQRQVRPALPVAQTSAQAASNGHPAQPATASLTVQIAAVSHEEDADVLVGALRKRGYEVNARRESSDNLIHVRIGPFKTRDDANRWRTKLLNDGYNAIVQP